MTTTPSQSPAGINRYSLSQRKAIAAYVFLIPAILYFAIFFFFPIGLEFWASMQGGQPLIGPSEYVAFENYQHALSDERTLHSFGVTAVFAVGGTILNAAAGLGLALLLNQPLKGRTLIRSIIFFPYMISAVIVSLMWRNILDPYLGVFNSLLGAVGLPLQYWLTDLNAALPTIIALGVWQGMGYSMVLFLAGLQNIPEMYYEAAMIDGANTLARFRYITLPLLAPTTLFVTVIGMIGNLQAFAPAYLITRGGPADATRLYAYHVFNVAFTELNFGYASAQAFLMFLVILVLTIVQLRVGGQDVEY